MTLVIGAKCKDGVVLVADRRVIRGVESSEEKKIISPLENFVVGFSGNVGIMDKFVKEIDHLFEKRELARQQGEELEDLTWRAFFNWLEELMKWLYDRYNPRLKALSDEFDLSLLIGCKQFEYRADLYFMNRTGIAYEIKSFEAIGSGRFHAMPFLKAIYDEGISIERMVKLGVFIVDLLDAIGVDLTVGGLPQVFVLPNIGSPYELTDKEILAILDEIGDSRERLRKIID
jgi:20S proteasome alpha/beta subunit